MSPEQREGRPAPARAMAAGVSDAHLDDTTVRREAVVLPQLDPASASLLAEVRAGRWVIAWCCCGRAFAARPHWGGWRESGGRDHRCPHCGHHGDLERLRFHLRNRLGVPIPQDPPKVAALAVALGHIGEDDAHRIVDPPTGRVFELRWAPDAPAPVCSACGTRASPWSCSCGATRLNGKAVPA